MLRLSIHGNLLHSSTTLLRQPLPKPFLPLYRHVSTKPQVPPPPPRGPTSQEEVSKSPQRFERLLNRTPKFTRNWIQPIANRPLSHITAFLILHELTAIIPLVGLAYLFHKTQWMPEILPYEWIAQGTEKGARLIRKLGINVHGEQFVRLAVEIAAAYATVKVLMPLRVIVSVWLTPWFARIFIVPFLGLFRRKKPVSTAPPPSNKP